MGEEKDSNRVTEASGITIIKAAPTSIPAPYKDSILTILLELTIMRGRKPKIVGNISIPSQ